MTEYARVRSLFQKMDYNLAVGAILQGAVPAKVYVDDPACPQAALTWTKHRFYLAACDIDEAEDDNVGCFLLETLWSQVPHRGEAAFMVYAAPDSRLDLLGQILEAGQPIMAQRQHYVFKELKNDWRAVSPEGFSIQPIEPSLLADASLTGLDDLKDEMSSERRSVEEFLRKSFGLCSIHGNAIVGWCLSEYNGPGCCEVGIGVNSTYRRRGIATALASAFVEEALSRGVSHIGWHSFANNKASVATARKMGFEKASDYPVLIVRFKGLGHLDAHGDSHLLG